MAFGQYVNLDFADIKQSIRDYLQANTNFTDYDFEGSNLSTILDFWHTTPISPHTTQTWLRMRFFLIVQL